MLNNNQLNKMIAEYKKDSKKKVIQSMHKAGFLVTDNYIYVPRENASKP